MRRALIFLVVVLTLVAGTQAAAQEPCQPSCADAAERLLDDGGSSSDQDYGDSKIKVPSTDGVGPLLP